MWLSVIWFQRVYINMSWLSLQLILKLHQNLKSKNFIVHSINSYTFLCNINCTINLTSVHTPAESNALVCLCINIFHSTRIISLLFNVFLSHLIFYKKQETDNLWYKKCNLFSLKIILRWNFLFFDQKTNWHQWPASIISTQRYCWKFYLSLLDERNSYIFP